MTTTSRESDAPPEGASRQKRRWLKRLPGVVPLGSLSRSMLTPLGRGRLLASMRGARLFQPATMTREDRHPELFAFLAERLAGMPTPTILSFGCSTGEEAFTLARYLPHATIQAIDANPACIARARRTARRRGLDRIAFRCADTPDAAAPEVYDAVVCLSVLRHGDLDALHLESSTSLFPFSRFAEAVARLDQRVAPGGLLLLWGCHFRFENTVTARHYRIIQVPGARPEHGHVYGPDDRRLPASSVPALAFIKQRDAAAMIEEREWLP